MLNTGDFLTFIHLLERLKNTTRHSWTSENRHESVAEHSWRLAVMALLLKPYYPEMNFDKVLTMALLHDLGEATEGDIPDFDKTENDAAEEDREIVRLLEDHKSFLSGRVKKVLMEYLDSGSPEARFVNALDRLEAVIQHNEAPLTTWTPREYELNLTHGEKESDGFSQLRELRTAVRAETKKKIGKGGIPEDRDGT